MIKTTVKIEGMACGMCEAHMNDVFRKAFELKSVTSSFKKKESVLLSEKQLDSEVVKKVVEGAGYKYISSYSEPNLKKGLFSFFK